MIEVRFVMYCLIEKHLMRSRLEDLEFYLFPWSLFRF